MGVEGRNKKGGRKERQRIHVTSVLENNGRHIGSQQNTVCMLVCIHGGYMAVCNPRLNILVPHRCLKKCYIALCGWPT